MGVGAVVGILGTALTSITGMLVYKWLTHDPHTYGPYRHTMIIEVAGWGCGSLAGALVAAAVARQGSVVTPLCIAIMLTGFNALNFVTEPVPTWFWLAGIAAGVLPGVLVSIIIILKRRREHTGT